MKDFISASLRVLKSYRGQPDKWAQAWDSIEQTARTRFGLSENCPIMVTLWNQGSKLKL